MPLIKTLEKFFVDDDAAVTVDWVVLTAAIVAFAAGASLVAMPGINQLASHIGDTTGTLQVGFDQIANPAPEAQN